MFRVYLFSPPCPGCAVETFDLTDVDVLGAVEWAQEHAGSDRLFAVALVAPGYGGGGDSPDRGLVWLLGIDANEDPSETNANALAGMDERRSSGPVPP